MKPVEPLLKRLGLDFGRFYQQSQSAGGVGAWIYACGDGAYWWSDEIYRIYGLPHGTPLTPELYMNSIVEEDRSAVRGAFDRLMAGGTYHVVYRVEVRGRLKWLEQRATYHHGKDCPEPYVLGMVRDVTALKAEQDRLESRRANFAAITAYLAETTDTTDLRAIVTSVKRTVLRRIDVAAMGVFIRRGDEVSRVIPRGADSMRVFQFQDIHDFVGYRAIMAGKPVSCRVEEYPNAVGREAVELLGGEMVVALPIRHQRTVIGAMSIILKEKRLLKKEEHEFCRTICSYLSNQLNNALLYEQLKRELTLRVRLESDRDVIFNESVDCICIIDREGNFAQINPAFAACLGFSPEALVGRAYFDFVYPEDRPFARYTFDLLPERKVIRGACNRFLCQNGKVAYLESNLKYMEETGNTIVIARDVTNLRQAEARNIDLEQSIALEKMKSEFFSNLSHEFKTPLNIIISSLDLMRMKQEREGAEHFRAEYGKFFDYAYQNCYRLLRLTVNLLDSTRIDHQYLSQEAAPMELTAMLRDIVESAKGYAQARCLTLTFTSQTAGEAWALCDANHLDRILLNLLSNAIKHTGPGGAIRVTVDEIGQFYRVTVTDNGSGIAPELLPYIFEKFRTGHADPSEKQGGSGVGLFLVKALVELGGGTVWAESTLGVGSSFTFTVPRTHRPAEGAEEPPFRADHHRTQAKLELTNLE